MTSAGVLPALAGCGEDSLAQLLSSLSVLENLVSDVRFLFFFWVFAVKKRLKSPYKNHFFSFFVPAGVLLD